MAAEQDAFLGKKLSLRIRSSTGVARLEQPIGDGDLLSRLYEIIALATSIPVEDIIVRHGFPPKVLTADPSTELSAVGIASGDTLVIERRAASAAPTPSSAPAPSPSSAPVPAASPSPSASSLHSNPATHASSSASSAAKSKGTVQYSSAGSQGFVVRRVVDADNSCLFTSVGYVLQRTAGRKAHEGLRQVVASAIAANGADYSEAVLGKPPAQYCAWIQDQKSWGGEIELSILAKHFSSEIRVIDSQTCRVYRYGEGLGYDQMVMLIYDGIHYDPLALTFDKSAPSECDVTVFSSTDVEPLELALEIAREAQEKRQFTDTTSFTLRCLVCQEGFVGEQGATRHAAATGHTNFSEY